MDAMIKIDQEPRTFIATRAIQAGFTAMLFADCRSVNDVKNCVQSVKLIPQGGINGIQYGRIMGYGYVRGQPVTLADARSSGIWSFGAKIDNQPFLAYDNQQHPYSVFKMKDRFKAFYNIGIPAIMGMVFDERENKFKIINTCPSAGSCMHVCYATKGGYVQYQAVSEKQNLTLNLLYNHPDQYVDKAVDEIVAVIKKTCSTINRLTKGH
jgi:hypothetical protein